MKKKSKKYKRFYNSKTDILIKYLSSFGLTITFVSIIVELVGSFYFLSWLNLGSPDFWMIIMIACGFTMFIPLSLPSVTEQLIDLLKKCWEWTKTHIITIIIAISLVFVFLYFEKK